MSEPRSSHRRGSAREPGETDAAYAQRVNPTDLPRMPLRCRLRLHQWATVLIRCYTTPDVPGHGPARMQKTMRRCRACGLLTNRVRPLRNHEPARRIAERVQTINPRSTPL